MNRSGRSCSKFPPAFNIDLHVDDAAGVALEGERFNLKTIIILKEDLTWAEKIKETCLVLNEEKPPLL